MIARCQTTSSSASTCRPTQRRRTRRVSNNGCFAPLMARLSAKHKVQTVPRRRIPLSSIITNKAPGSAPASEQFPISCSTPAAPTVQNVCDEYIREKLSHFKDSMYAGLRDVRYANALPRSNILPKEIQIIMDHHSDAISPTHMLAVFPSQTTPKPAKTNVTLYPAHGIVLSAHCANLPKLPESLSESTIPVVPLALPSPHMYPYLQTYLYSKDISMLEKVLLPSSLPLNISVLVRQLLAVRGLWANAHALGVVDAPLYEMMDRVCLTIRQSIIAVRSIQQSSA